MTSADEINYQVKIFELEKKLAVMYQKSIDSDKALVVALNTLNFRLDEMNNFRAQILEERANFMLKETFDDKHEKLEVRVASLSDWRSNMEGRFWALGAALGTFIIVVEAIFKWLIK